MDHAAADDDDRLSRRRTEPGVRRNLCPDGTRGMGLSKKSEWRRDSAATLDCDHALSPLRLEDSGSGEGELLLRRDRCFFERDREPRVRRYRISERRTGGDCEVCWICTDAVQSEPPCGHCSTTGGRAQGCPYATSKSAGKRAVRAGERLCTLRATK